MELVTGATGFIGRALVRRLSAAGRPVRCLVRPGSYAPELELPGVETARGDLLDQGALEAAVKGAARVWHLGALVRPAGFLTGRKELLNRFHAVNAEAVGRLAGAAAGAGVKRFVYFSSVSALGPGTALRDDAAPRPLTHYGRSKLAGEELLKAAAAGTALDYVILRPAMIYGAGAPAWERLFAQVRRGRAALPGRGLNTFSVCYVENLIDAALLAADKAPSGGAFNVSEGAVAVRDLLLTVGELLGRRPLLLRVPPAAVKAAAAALEPLLGAAGLYMPSFIGTDRARAAEACASWSHECEGLKALGWKPALGTREGLAAMLGVKP